MPVLRSHSRRRTPLVAGIALAALLTAGVLSAPPAVADTSATLTVVGTSDVFDSNLIQSVIQPDFQAAFPGITLNYVSKGSGAAIQYAETGAASALLVHAPSLENQFVAAGYSDFNAPGTAFFWGDYVLLGPNSDPARIKANDQHDIVGAFERVAAAGAQGRANFVSRGGTPGTTVQEHQIWADTTGVTVCQVDPTLGGGASPSTVTGPCPVNIPYPSWYHATGLTQGPNIINADVCNYPSADNNCYVFTDRGTYQYLRSTDAAQELQIVVRGNNANSTGGVALLVNSFHGYAVNPAKFTGSVAAGINETAAQDFLQFVTSPAEQTKIGQYLNGSNDPPFLPDASPTLTASAPPASTSGAKTFTISGTLTNKVPGTPPLAGQPLALFATDTAPTPVTTQLAVTTTDSRGRYSFKVTPTRSESYLVHTDEITQVEYPDLDPPFSDLLAPANTTAGSNTVLGLPTIKKAVAKKGSLTLTGTLAPPPVDGNATLTLSASNNGGAATNYGPIQLTAGQTKFTATFALPSGTYTYHLLYQDVPYIAPGNSATKTTTVP